MDTNKDKTKNEILEIYRQLPKIIQDAIIKSGWEKTLQNLVQKYKLRIDQGTQLENMTFALMMGQFSAEEYYKSILNEFELEEDQAKSLFQEIDDNIFGSIEDVIQKLEQDQSRKELDKKIAEKETYLKDDVTNASMDDEILTVTRDEILKGIEKPERIDMPIDHLPKIKDSAVMPDANKVQNPKPQTGLDVKETEIPANLPTTEKTPEIQKPVDPVEAGFGAKVTTSTKDYKTSDPYREPIE